MTRGRLIIFGAVAGTLLAGSVFGGENESEARCREDAQVCLHAMAEKLGGRGWIGIEIEKDGARPRISKVVPGSPASRAELQVDDFLVAFNGVPTDDGEEAVYAEIQKSLVPGRRITLTVERDGISKEVDLTLAKIPDQLLAQWIGQHMLKHHVESSETPER